MKPAKGILDPSFRYVPSGQTNIRKTFARARKAQREAAEQAKADAAKVTPIVQRKTAK